MTDDVKRAEADEYLAFLGKFDAKKTTDDCYTPPGVYVAVREFCESEYGTAGRRVVRPFVPGGNYTEFDYQEGDVVIDNPPFSIMTKIVRFYESRGIDFFLFAPALTTLGINARTAVIAGANIKYANGATVKTNFVTSLDDVSKVRSAPALKAAIDKAIGDEKPPALPRYGYPRNLITSATLGKYTEAEFSVRHDDFIAKVSALDSQRAAGKGVFGGGFLVSDRAADEIERAAESVNDIRRERAIREAMEAKDHEWPLSAREREMIDQAGR